MDKAQFGVQILGVVMIVSPDNRVLVVDANHFSGAPSSVPGFVDATVAAVRAHGQRMCDCQSEPLSQ